MKHVHEREIWLVDLNPTKGIEMKKMRPCLILKKFNQSHLVIIPLTSQEKKGKLYYQLPTLSFLSKTSYLHLSQIRAIDVLRCKRKKPYGRISDDLFTDIHKKTTEILQSLSQKDECP